MLLYLLSAAVVLLWRFWPNQSNSVSVSNNPDILPFRKPASPKPVVDCCPEKTTLRKYRDAESILKPHLNETQLQNARLEFLGKLFETKNE